MAPKFHAQFSRNLLPFFTSMSPQLVAAFQTSTFTSCRAHSTRRFDSRRRHHHLCTTSHLADDVLHIRESSRVALQLQYRGTDFCGWAKQLNPPVRTVQGVLQSAIRDITLQDVTVFGASRTDSGAHARAQVAHFDAPPVFANPRAWIGALNARLPQDVRIIDAARTVYSFDARRDTLCRRYRYTIRASSREDVFADLFAWRIRKQELCIDSMKAAAKSLSSEQSEDLSALRKSNAQATHARIRVIAADVHAAPESDEIFVDVTADWFVYGMMRLLTYALVQVGAHEVSVEEFVRRIRTQERGWFRSSAPAKGLCLMQVAYPKVIDPFNRKIDG